MNWVPVLTGLIGKLFKGWTQKQELRQAIHLRKLDQIARGEEIKAEWARESAQRSGPYLRFASFLMINYPLVALWMNPEETAAHMMQVYNAMPPEYWMLQGCVTAAIWGVVELKDVFTLRAAK